MSEQKVFFKNSKGMKLAAWLHVPDGKGFFPAVVKAHGYRSSKEGTKAIALGEELKDFVYFRFDFHGHGESEGKLEDVDAAQCVDDLKCAIEYIRELSYVDKNKIGITGSSLGGLATTLAAAWHDKVACAVPVCPVSQFEPFRARQIKYQKLVMYDVYEEAEKIKCPVLIIHGDADSVVPIKDSLELVKHLEKGRLHAVKGADHMFSASEHFKEMIKETVKFMRENLK